MGTTLPALLTKANWDQNSDEVLLALAEAAANFDKVNTLISALGAAAQRNIGDGLGTTTQAAGTPDLLKILASSSFRFAGGTMELSDFVTVESDDDIASHNAPPDLNLKRKKTGIVNNDSLGIIKFRGSNAAAKENDIQYALIQGSAVDVTAGSEDGQLGFRTIQAGAGNNDQLRLRQGLYGRVSGSDVTGGDTGEGTCNFQDVYRRGALMPFQEAYNSGEQTITAAGALTLAHGLTRTPILVTLSLICKTIEHGYAVNDEVMINPASNDAGTASDSGISIVFDATNVNVRFGAASNVFRVFNKTTGVSASTTIANWRLRVRAFA